MTIKPNDANVSANLGITKIQSFNHKIYRVTVSNDKEEVPYVSIVDDIELEEMLDFFKKYTFETFKKLDTKEQQCIYKKIMNLFQDLILNCENLMQKYVKNNYKKTKEKKMSGANKKEGLIIFFIFSLKYGILLLVYKIR